jgi:hypothetical protein
MNRRPRPDGRLGQDIPAPGGDASPARMTRRNTPSRPNSRRSRPGTRRGALARRGRAGRASWGGIGPVAIAKEALLNPGRADACDKVRALARDAAWPRPMGRGWPVLPFSPQACDTADAGDRESWGSDSRVAGKHRCFPAPSELHVTVARHAAQAFTNAPRGTRPLWQRPSRYAPGADGTPARPSSLRGNTSWANAREPHQRAFLPPTYLLVSLSRLAAVLS